MMQPLVSICCLTYNHAPFIRKCLDGFLMQETSFPVEILIHDDASTDGTVDIIKEYTEKYPDRIFPLFEEENQYSKPHHKHLDLYNYERARGKYIAYCEGDDYWTDPFKLQKQVDFLEANPEYSVCWHRRSFVNEEDEIISDDLANEGFLPTVEGINVSLETYLTSHFVQPLTMVFRYSALDFDNIRKFKYFSDTQEIFFLLKQGVGYVLNFNGGCYRIHSGGVFSHLSRLEYSYYALPRVREFYWKTQESVPKKLYVETLETSFQVFRSTNKWKAFICAVEYAIVSGHPKSLIRHLRSFLGYS